MIEPPTEPQHAYTFLGLGEDGATRFMDIAVLPAANVEAHAEDLLRQHDSSAALEIWQSAQLVGIKSRTRLRPPLPTGKTSLEGP